MDVYCDLLKTFLQKTTFEKLKVNFVLISTLFGILIDGCKVFLQPPYFQMKVVKIDGSYKFFFSKSMGAIRLFPKSMGAIRLFPKSMGAVAPIDPL